MTTRSILTRLGTAVAPGSPFRNRLQGLLGEGGNASGQPAAQQAALDERLGAVETAVKHLESTLEGLQDAVHRRSQLDDQRNDDLLRRMADGAAQRDRGGEGRDQRS